jgi:hypothetical protein
MELGYTNIYAGGNGQNKHRGIPFKKASKKKTVMFTGLVDLVESPTLSVKLWSSICVLACACHVDKLYIRQLKQRPVTPRFKLRWISNALSTGQTVHHNREMAAELQINLLAGNLVSSKYHNNLISQHDI